MNNLQKIIVVVFTILLVFIAISQGCKQKMNLSPASPRPDNRTFVEVLAFTARYCSPCKPAIAVLNSWSPGDSRRTVIQVTVIDVNSHPDIAREYSVQSTPTFIVKVNSQIVEQTNNVAVAISAASRSIE
jgi:thiol-disulfide isomerase/thioredoxin